MALGRGPPLHHQTPRPGTDRRITVRGGFVSSAVAVEKGGISLRGQMGMPSLPR
jgi:hypothetical protein